VETSTPTLLRDLTTLRLGGPAGRLVEAADEDALVAAVRRADRAGEPLLVLAGGSNVVVADAGFPGTVVRVATRERLRRSPALLRAVPASRAPRPAGGRAGRPHV